MINRRLKKPIVSWMFKGKAIILVGARQVGKTTLLKEIDSEMSIPAERLNCDDPTVRALLSNPSLSQLQLLLTNKRMVIIDEAQRVDNIGITLKMITDNLPDVQIMVTGSSSLGLRSSLNEPLTGRKIEFVMYPISTGELFDTYGLSETLNVLHNRLIYGSYPDVLTHEEDAAELLTMLSDSYLYKDILELDSVRKPEVLRKLLVALALQVGSEVSYNELSKTIGTDSKTVERYIDLLEKCYVVFKLPAL
ncbi:MAG: AAA family ATPase, partial [Muribaculaceae bacterium]|nr:AAA family ATPase [Muribaculaceae bacterium]